MMNQHQTALTSLLLGSFPTFQSGDAEAALAAYELVMASSDERDWQPGVKLLINLECPAHDGRFAPTAPQFAAAVRQARDERHRTEHLNRLAIAPPPEPEISEAERERVAAGLKKLAEDIAEKLRTEDAERTRRWKELSDKTNLRFMPSMDDAEIRTRLGFTTGDRDGHEDAAA